MLALMLAAVAAAAYGAADFSGALASKRVNAMVITVVVQGVSMVALDAVLVAAPVEHRRWADLGWGALGGLGAAVALVCFYRALAGGPMAATAAVTALVGTTVPVVVGLALGERPSGATSIGILACVPAATLVAAGSPRASRAALPRQRPGATSTDASTLWLAVAAGAGFGLFFVALSRSSADSGLFPLVGARAASVVALAAVLTWRRGWEALDATVWPKAVVAGVLDCAANAAYVLAVGRGELAWVAAVTSLYPVSTVVLARVVLRERLGRAQTVGLGLSAAALVLVAAGR